MLVANDLGSHEQTGGGNIVFDNADENTNHLTCFYLSATKHFIKVCMGEHLDEKDTVECGQ